MNTQQKRVSLPCLLAGNGRKRCQHFSLDDNVAIIYEENMLELNVPEIMREQFNCIQKAFWFDTREQKLQGRLFYIMLVLFQAF